MSEWINVKDRLPDDYGWFIVNDTYLVSSNNVTMGFFDGDSAVVWLPLDQRLDQDSMNVTHWMPLPEPPKDMPI